MKTHFRTVAIAVTLTMVLGSATNDSAARSPPRPPPYNPQIAFAAGSQGANTVTFYVANADGTDVVALYSTRNLTSGLKLAPTGNRLVFNEGNAVRALTYAVSSQGVTTTSVTTLSTEPFQPLHVDVSPDGTAVLVVEKNGIVNQYAVFVVSLVDGTRTQVLLTPDLYYDAVWAHSNSRIAVIQGGPVQAGFGTQTIQVVDLDPTNNYDVLNTTTIFTNTGSQLYQVNRIESAHTSDTLLFNATANSSINVYTINIGPTPVVSPPIVAGSNASLNADDSAILFVAPTGPPYFYELNLGTGAQTLINSSRGIAEPDFLP